MKFSLFGLIVAGVLGLVPPVASAATVLVVHGINGEDLGLPRALPVDIAVNGSCALRTVTFGASTQVELTAGSYLVTVHPSTGNCSAAPVITQTVAIPDNVKSIGLVAQISDGGTPRLQVFVNDAPSGSILVNNAAKGEEFFAGAGLKGLVFYFAKPLGNGSSVRIAEFGKNRRLAVTLIRTNQKKPFYKNTFRAGKSVVVYTIGSKKKGVLVISGQVD